VLPPPQGWYLIDFGPFARMKPEADDSKVTDYSTFFDMEHLRAAVPVITAQEFVKREGKRFNMPEAILNATPLNRKEGIRQWESWVKAKDTGGTTGDQNRKLLAWSPLSHVIYYPSINSVEKQFHTSGGVPKGFGHHREIVEITSEIADSPAIVFPSCLDNDNFRYLVQVNTIAAFADEALSRSYKRMLRDHVHYPRIVFDIAARVVEFLGPFQYASLHVRRNELQYKEVFLQARETMNNVAPLLKKGERLYIASDETQDSWFDEFNNEYQVYRWKDFFTEKGGNVLSGVYIPRKLEGCIEQVICAYARIFAGTLESTFSSYIFRLRGYYHAPNTEVYFHTLAYSGVVKKDRFKTWSKKPLKGQIYKSEHPSIWEDAELPLTKW